MRGAQHKLQSQLNKNHSSHVHIFLLWLQSFSSDGQSTLCLLQQEIAVSKAPQPLRFPPAPKLRWFCTSLQCHRGQRNALCCLAVVTPSSASPLSLPPSPALCVTLGIQFEDGHASRRVLSTQNKRGDVVAGKKRFNEACGNRAWDTGTRVRKETFKPKISMAF